MSKTTSTIFYAGQGYIYRCPGCRRPDRMPWLYGAPPMEAECRFCRESFRPIEVSEMDAGLHSVIREINALETGTPFGMSPEQLSKSDLVKAGRSVGIDVEAELSLLGTKGGPPGDYFAPWRTDQAELREMYKTPDGREILEAAAPIMMGDHTAESLVSAGKRIPNEILEEARMMVLMKHSTYLTRDEKIATLRKAGFNPSIDPDGRVYVFFASTYAPECDSWCYWD